MCVDLLLFYIQNFYTSYYMYNNEPWQWWSYTEVTAPSWNHYFILCDTFVTLSIMELSWMTTPSLQKKWNSNTHQQSQTRKVNGRSERRTAKLTTLKVWGKMYLTIMIVTYHWKWFYKQGWQYSEGIIW
jgi:hypothetical protein